MGANDLILQLRTNGFSISAANSRLQIAPASKLTDELKQTIKQRKDELIAQLQQEAQQEARRLKVLTILEDNPETQRAVITDVTSDPENVIVTVGIKSVSTFELLISKARYDAFQLMSLVDTHGSQATH
jgi:DNA-binding transcriptional MerR regulator